MQLKLLALGLIACVGAIDALGEPAAVGAPRLLTAAAEPANWLAKGRDWTGQFYSPLARINATNVASLGVAWEYDANPRRGRVLRGLEATPIVVDGVLYTSLAWSEVVALDASTGRELWRFDPKADGASDRRGCCDGVNRGVAVWEGRVYVGTMDGFLIAVDAHNGQELWRSDTFVDRSRPYTITGAPQVAGNVVVIGNGGSEFGVRGYVSAYDLKTGALRWRFYTVPGDPKLGFEAPELKWASKTWNPRSDWISGGGGTVWDGMAYDPQLSLLYIGTGNSAPYPNWFRSPGNGDNLFLASILAIDPDSGRLKWHYQTTPGEMWDYDATQPLVLADLKLNGRTRKVLMQACKNGFFYVLDRANGQLLSAKNYVYVNWASHVDLKTGRPVLTGKGWYKDEPKLVFPGQTGGHNWMPMSYSPQTGLVYIPSIDTPMLFAAAADYKYRPGEFNMAADGAFPPVPNKYLDPNHTAAMREQLVAWDPVAERKVWEMPLGGFFNGGVLSTGGGIVLQGTSGGHFIAYEARTGKMLRDIEVGTGIMAAPSTYEVNGEQYVAVMAGYGGAMLKMFANGVAARTYRNEPRIIAFRLNGGPARLPPHIEPATLPDQPYELTASEATLEKGKGRYMTHCARCHGGFWEAVPSGYPDLKRMPPATHELFEQIVLDGLLRGNGMASFADVLQPEDVRAIQAYLKSETNRLIAGQGPAPAH
jgi:quinohemoprotein ethanol dehydrogenase